MSSLLGCTSRENNIGSSGAKWDRALPSRPPIWPSATLRPAQGPRITSDRCTQIDEEPYFPILDEDLPNLNKLHGVASLCASLVAAEHRVLSHCGMGFNRSALVAGLTLHKLGMPGSEVVTRLRTRRPGALFNDRFASFLETL